VYVKHPAAPKRVRRPRQFAMRMRMHRLYGLACTDDALPSGKLKAMKDAFSAEPKSVVSYYDLLSLVVNCNVHRQRVLIALYVSRKEFGQLETAVFFACLGKVPPCQYMLSSTRAFFVARPQPL